MWHEALAKRGGNEISSCIYQHLLSEPSNVEHVIFYSDGCVGQNKNSFMSAMFMIFLQSSTNIRIIDHKFLLSGHTHMECDVDHSIIERKKKRTNPQINHPLDWYQFVRQASSTRIFKVIEMNQDHIYDFSNIIKTKCFWRNRDNEGGQFKWADVKWLRYSKQFGLIQYKNSLDESESFKELNIRKRGFPKIDHSDLKKCYNGPIQINKLKKKDLMDQLPLINELYHEFYKNLKDDDSPMVDPDLSDETESEEENFEANPGE